MRIGSDSVVHEPGRTWEDSGGNPGWSWGIPVRFREDSGRVSVRSLEGPGKIPGGSLDGPVKIPGDPGMVLGNPGKVQ